MGRIGLDKMVENTAHDSVTFKVSKKFRNTLNW